MTHIELTKSLGNLVFTACILIGMIFLNFLLRKGNAEVLGISIPSQTIHLVLGPILILINAIVVILLFTMFAKEISPIELSSLQSFNPKFFLGPLLNPFYVHENKIIDSVGYGFLIVLWWLGMHSFLYSINLNPDSPLLFSWEVLISVLYLALGLTSMWGIQMCWSNWAISDYNIKLIGAFVGIPLGAFLPPIILKLGLPKINFG